MPDTQPLVSIIILSYNQGTYIDDAIQSALNQTYKNIEVLISDNGSTDETKEIMHRYHSNPKVRLLDYPKNGAVTKRQNRAVRHAAGKYISLLYADDYYLPTKIQRQVELFDTLDETWVLVHGPGYILDKSNVMTLDQESIRAHGFCLKEMLNCRAGGINPISPLIKTDCYLEHPLYEELFNEGEGVFFKFALKNKFYYHENAEVVMRRHDKNMGKSIVKNNEIFTYCLEMLISHKDFSEDLTSHVICKIAYEKFITAKTLIKDLNLDIQSANTLTQNAWKLDKKLFLSPSGILLLLLKIIPPILVINIFKLLRMLQKNKSDSTLNDYYS